MKRFQMLCALALPGLVLAACDRTPSEPNAVQTPSFLVVPAATVERAIVCKAYTGTATADSFSFTGVNTDAALGNPFHVAAETCRTVRIKGADTIRVSATETAIAAGVQLDSVVVYQFNQDLGGTTHTNLGAVTTGSVYAGGAPRSGGVIVFYNSDIPQQTGEGCTPGYWKNHISSWAATGYSPGQTVSSVFNVGTFTSLGTATLLQALSFEGGSGAIGGARILLRAAVAALLNSADPTVDYPRTTAEVIADVNAALATGDRATMLTLAGELDADNNLGCPLN